MKRLWYLPTRLKAELTKFMLYLLLHSFFLINLLTFLWRSMDLLNLKILKQIQYFPLIHPTEQCISNCSNNGTCSSTGTCKCNAGFRGDLCHIPNSIFHTESVNRMYVYPQSVIIGNLSGDSLASENRSLFIYAQMISPFLSFRICVLNGETPLPVVSANWQCQLIEDRYINLLEFPGPFDQETVYISISGYMNQVSQNLFIPFIR